VLFLQACKNNPSEKTIKVSDDLIINKTSHPGKKLMETNCYVCHSPDASLEDRIGPPMIGIKKNYTSENSTKEAFIKNIQNWIKNPTKETAKMQEAVKRFGVMPITIYTEETIKQIADYMYDYEIEQPEWFKAHYNELHGIEEKLNIGEKKTSKDNEDLSYEDLGMKYAMGTKVQLGKNLMGAIQKKGTLAAIEFCNVRAYPITDSMATVYNAQIKRVSDKPRNPKNKANSHELEYINVFKKIISIKEEPKPILEETDNKVTFYYPITTNSMCLQCHGVPGKTIENEAFEKIKELYSTDMAIGYDVNEVRGIWRIDFNKK
jgi:cytochrome c553